MIILASIIILSILYVVYQIARIRKLYKIRVNWIETDDIRYTTTSYDEQVDPNKTNWYGFKWPKDSDYLSK